MRTEAQFAYMPRQLTLVDRLSMRLAATYARHHPWLTASEDTIETTSECPIGETTLFRDCTDETSRIFADAHARPLDIFQPPN